MGDLIIVLPVLLFSVIVHEVAHGWTALQLGDPTAARLGRLTLNPAPHVDPVMSLLLPAVCLLSHMPVLGGARPVPVNPRNFRHPSRGMAIVAAAGPASNLVLALLAGLAVRAVPYGGATSEALFRILVYAFQINTVLAAFNLLPIPPLDGSRIVAHFLRGKAAVWYASLERVGILILLAMLWLLGGPLMMYLDAFQRAVAGVIS